MKRLAIYVHYDKNGDVKDYVTYCIKGLQEVITDILVVVNGELDQNGREALQSLGVDILVRENQGYDFSAWKSGIEHYGYDKIAEYDELLLTNNTFYGPIYPFSEMWSAMDKVDCDFWGINQHPERNLYPLNYKKQVKIKEYIQTYWVVFKSSILKSSSFRDYWDNYKANKCVDYSDYDEVQLTIFFKNQGYKSATYMDFDKYSKLLPARNPLFLTHMQVVEDRCPVAIRKYFYDYKYYLIKNSTDDGPRLLLEFFRNNTDYNPNMILDDLLPTIPLSKLNNNFVFNTILPSDHAISSKQTDKKVVCVMYIYYKELVGYFRQYIDSLPAYVDVVLVTVFDSVVEACRAAFEGVPNNVEYRVQQNRGRENAGLFITCKDVIKNYDYLCIVHGKKSIHIEVNIQGEEFRNHNFKSLLYNKNYVENIINTFDNDPRLGVFIPFPYSASICRVVGKELGIRENYHSILSLFNDYLHVNITEVDEHIMFPAGGMYWAKTSAMKTMTSYDWQFEDFPEEPMPNTDGMLPHAIERSVCLAAQVDGYYSFFVAPDKYGSMYLNDLYYYKQEMEYKRRHFREAKNDILKYYGYKLLSFITFGETKKKYIKKQNAIKFIYNDV